MAHNFTDRAQVPQMEVAWNSAEIYIYKIIIIMYIYHALISTMSAHMIHINLNMIFYTHVEHSPTKTVYITKNKNKKHTIYER